MAGAVRGKKNRHKNGEVWGIDVKPGTPIILSPDTTQGRRFIIYKALLGDQGEETSTNKSVYLQCQVGNRSPVLLCSLLPNTMESCQLRVEFEEEEDVIFSVIGSRTLHLKCFYCRACFDEPEYKEEIEYFTSWRNYIEIIEDNNKP
ncbi:hypothetical protein ACJIZ3_019612 [Penstemon smallii]|uniref:peptidylprolyl isomerase n=1 Tax=Penstemon smallii TaxID=265156 RepID=A0ABD3T1Q4_9LAMI